MKIITIHNKTRALLDFLCAEPQSQPKTQPQLQSQKQTAPLSGYTKYVALYEFTARSFDELSFKVGEEIWVCLFLVVSLTCYIVLRLTYVYCH